MEDRCVACGAVVPEGRQVCPICEARACGAEEVFWRYTDTAGNFHWCGVNTGQHVIRRREEFPATPTA